MLFNIKTVILKNEKVKSKGKF